MLTKQQINEFISRKSSSPYWEADYPVNLLSVKRGSSLYRNLPSAYPVLYNKAFFLERCICSIPKEFCELKINTDNTSLTFDTNDVFFNDIVTREIEVQCNPFYFTRLLCSEHFEEEGTKKSKFFLPYSFVGNTYGQEGVILYGISQIRLTSGFTASYYNYNNVEVNKKNCDGYFIVSGDSFLDSVEVAFDNSRNFCLSMIGWVLKKKL